MEDVIIPVFNVGDEYFMTLKNKTHISIPKTEYLDIINSNENIRRKYENSDRIQRSAMDMAR